MGSRFKGKGSYLDIALLVLLAFVVLILPCASYGALTKSPRLLEHWAARWACFVVACLAVLLAFEFGVLVKVSDFCVAPDSNFRDLVDRRIAISSADAELVDYYVSCGGANPLLAPLNNSLAEITFLDDAAALALAADAVPAATAAASVAEHSKRAAELREPHRVARFLEDTASVFNKWYDTKECRMLPQGDEPAGPANLARLVLVHATRTVLANGLDLLGVTAPERM